LPAFSEAGRAAAKPGQAGLPGRPAPPAGSPSRSSLPVR